MKVLSSFLIEAQQRSILIAIPETTFLCALGGENVFVFSSQWLNTNANIFKTCDSKFIPGIPQFYLGPLNFSSWGDQALRNVLVILRDFLVDPIIYRVSYMSGSLPDF